MVSPSSAKPPILAGENPWTNSKRRNAGKLQAVIIAAAIFAARDLANDWNGGRSPRAIAAAANAIEKAKFLVEEIERRLQ